MPLFTILIGLLNQASGGWRPALTWFLEIAFVYLIGMHVCLSAARLLIIIHIKLNNQSNKSYCFSVCLYDTLCRYN